MLSRFGREAKRILSSPERTRISFTGGRSSIGPRSVTFATMGKHSFLPLGQTQDQVAGGALKLEGIVFDMDGTLFGIPKSSDILDHIHALPEPEQSEAMKKIQDIEREAMAKQVPQAGLVTLMEWLDQQGVKKAICTRNFDAPVSHLLTTHIPSHITPFTPVITRAFRPPKPSPAGILHIAHAWGLTADATVPASPPSQRRLPLVMVGDSIDDMVAGRDAGALTVLLRSVGKEELEQDDRTDVVVGSAGQAVEAEKSCIAQQYRQIFYAGMVMRFQFDRFMHCRADGDISKRETRQEVQRFWTDIANLYRAVCCRTKCRRRSRSARLLTKYSGLVRGMKTRTRDSHVTTGRILALPVYSS
nr:putative uncharacterized hydrolase [Quercus suber]